jgi:hypothetical protein
MGEPIESVYATDDEEKALKVRDRLNEKKIETAIRINSENYVFGPGVLNRGIFSGRYEVLVSEDDVERALDIVSTRRQKGELAKSEPTSTKKKPNRAKVPIELLDKKYFSRSIVLGIAFLAGLGTILAVDSATRISKKNKARKTIAFLVPIGWYALFFIAFLFISFPFFMRFAGLSIAIFGSYLSVRNRKILYLSILVVGVAIFVASFFL